MFANDVTLMLAAKTKTEQDEWLNAIMKGLSQGVSVILVLHTPHLRSLSSALQ